MSGRLFPDARLEAEARRDEALAERDEAVAEAERLAAALLEMHRAVEGCPECSDRLDEVLRGEG